MNNTPTILARPVWVHPDAHRDDAQCSHRVPAHGSPTRFVRCVRERTDTHYGYPLCAQHFRQVMA